MEADDLDESTIGFDSPMTVFTQIPDWILANREINDGALRTWLALASFASNKHRTAFPSARTLMEHRGKGRRVIFQHLAQLEEAGLLRRQSRFRSNGGRTSNHYTLAWDRPLVPVQKSALGDGAETCTGGRAESSTGPRASKRATRTRTTKELDPPPPQQSEQPEPDLGSIREQGAAAPRTPRIKDKSGQRAGRRSDRTNPRALEAHARKETQMKSWANTMLAAVELEEFVDIVRQEIATKVVTAEQGAVAIEEAERIAGRTSTTRLNDDTDSAATEVSHQFDDE